MTTELEVLARRAVACKHWKWMPGMRVMVPPKYDGSTGFSIRLGEYGYVPAPNEYPDFTDPATMGCLLALVRNAWKEEDFASYQHDTDKWRVEIGTRAFTSDSEAAALVSALEAAP